MKWRGPSELDLLDLHKHIIKIKTKKWYTVTGCNYIFEKVMVEVQAQYSANVNLIALHNFALVNKNSQKHCQSPSQGLSTAREKFQEEIWLE